MDLMKFLKRTGNKNHTKGTAMRTAMFDTLEPRSLLSASPTVSSAGSATAESHFTVLAATKQSKTTLKIAKTSAYGSAVTISAAVQPKSGTGVPTGTVTFYAQGPAQGGSQASVAIGTGTLNSQGVARISISTFSVGSQQIYAEYNGSGKFQFSRTPAVTHYTTPAASTTKLSITTPTSTLIGNPTGMLARVGSTVNGVTPTGRVAFYDGGTLLGSKAVDANGHARWLANYLYIGTHQLKAIYLGNTQLLGHRSPVRDVTVGLPTMTTTSDGLKVGQVTAGSGGVVATTGDTITAHYTLYVNGVKNQSSLDSGQPFSFHLNNNEVIAGFDEGLAGVTAGEKRVLIVPPSLGYGNRPQGNIPPNSTLVFVVDVLNVTQNPS